MDAQATSPLALAVGRSDAPLTRIYRTVLFLTAIVAAVLSLLVLVRGTIGNLRAPSTTIGQLLPVVLAVTTVTLFRVAWNRAHPGGSQIQRIVIQIGGPSLCVVSICAAMSISGISIGAVVMLWVIVIGSELPWWRLTFSVRERDPTTLDHPSSRSLSQINVHDKRKNEEDEVDSNILQQITRSTDANNIEILSGILRAEFVVGDRSRNLHVAFCPPLEYKPEIVVHQLDGIPVDVKVAQTEVFGTRIELRLQSTATANETATVYFNAGPTQQIDCGY